MRAKNLADQAVNIWCASDISEESLDRFKPEKPVLKSYTIADHAFLRSGITRELFEAFRKEILNLDDNVREEFLKHYIAYKAETNFVDHMKNDDKSFNYARIADNDILIAMRFHRFSYQIWIMWQEKSYYCQFHSK